MSVTEKPRKDNLKNAAINKNFVGADKEEVCR